MQCFLFRHNFFAVIFLPLKQRYFLVGNASAYFPLILHSKSAIDIGRIMLHLACIKKQVGQKKSDWLSSDMQITGLLVLNSTMNDTVTLIWEIIPVLF